VELAASRLGGRVQHPARLAELGGVGTLLDLDLLEGVDGGLDVGAALVVVAIFLFAALVRPFGLVAATYVAFIVSIMGSSEMKWIESLIAAAVMTLFCYLLFVKLLGLPFQLWPQPNGVDILVSQFADIFKQTWIIMGKLVPFR
jgi:hypothetical protein